MSGTILLFLRIASAVALYLFLVWALLVLWRDLRRQSELLKMLQAPPLILLQQGSEALPFRLNAPEGVIGRDPACDLCLEDKTISARHARLSFHHRQWWVEDLGSKNGTFLNQQPVTEAVVITSGDKLQCGQVLLDVVIEAGQASNVVAT